MPVAFFVSDKGNYTPLITYRVNYLTVFIPQHHYFFSFGKTTHRGLFIKPAGIVRNISSKEN